MPLTSAEKSLESDLRSLMLAQGQTAAATSASSEISKDRPKPKKSKKQKKREMSVKKRRAVLKVSTSVDPRLKMTLMNDPMFQDPELYHALMRECSKEEKTPPHKDYVPPKIVTDYLVLNDVRPLKKVTHSDFSRSSLVACRYRNPRTQRAGGSDKLNLLQICQFMHSLAS